MKLRAVSVKPLDGTLHLEGELTVFVIYEAEDDTMPVQWLEETIPFSGEMEAEGVKGGSDPHDYGPAFPSGDRGKTGL